MIRVLTMIAVAGFVLSVASLSAAVALGGPDVISRGSWGFVEGERNWGWHNGHGHGGAWAKMDLGKPATRSLAWSGAKRLDIDLPADVRYIQQDGAATVELTGPEAALARVEINGDSIAYAHGFDWNGPRLTIVIRAPDIHAFDISGRNTLKIEGYRQPSVDIEASGQSDVKAEGQADELTLDASGASHVDLAGLKARSAEAEVSGGADTTLAPTERAKLDVSGGAEVNLLTTPRSLETNISGGGRLRNPAPAEKGKAA